MKEFLKRHALVTSACVAIGGLSPSHAAASARCLELSADGPQVRAARQLIDAECECDRATGSGSSAYRTCAKQVIATLSEAELRHTCSRFVYSFVRQSVCGLDPRPQPVPCVRTMASGRAACRITPTYTCAARGYSACPGATNCLDAADTNGDLHIGYDDTGTCAGATTTTRPTTTTTLPGGSQAQLLTFLENSVNHTEVEPSLQVGPPYTQVEPPLVCTVHDVSLSDNFDEILPNNPTGSLCPGLFISASSFSSTPDPVVVERKPLTMGITGIPIIDNECVVSPPITCPRVESCRARILQGVTTPSDAQFDSVSTAAYSQEQLAIRLKISALKHNTFGFDFQNIAVKSNAFLLIRQRCYTLEIQPEANALGYVAPSVTASDFAMQMSAGDEPLVIDRVVYGRLIMVQFSTSLETSAETLRLAIEGRLGRVGFTQELRSIYEQSEKRILILGGDPNAAARYIGTGELDDFINFLTIARCGVDFTGYPLFYSANRLSNGVPPYSSGITTEFQERTCQLNPGNRKWTVRTFGCDAGHDVRPIDLEGRPVCGSGNCSSFPCWGGGALAGDDAGDLSFHFDKDTQVRADTYVYSSTPIIKTIQVSGAVPRIWVNGVAQAPASQMALSLPAGTSVISATDMHQHDSATLQISGLGNGLYMDSNGGPTP